MYQLAAQLLPRPVQAHLHRFDRKPQHGGNLLQTQVAKIEQLHRLALVGRKIPDSGEKLPAQFHLLHHLLRIGGGVHRMEAVKWLPFRKLLQRQRPGLHLAQVAPAHVDHDPVQPASEALRLTQAVEREKSLQDGLLGQFSCLLLLPDHAQRHTLHQRMVALDQLPKRLPVAGAGARHQIRVCPLNHQWKASVSAKSYLYCSGFKQEKVT